MADENDDKKTDKPTLTMSKDKKLSLTKTVESGKVTQNFTHGRSKQVTVEVRRTRTFSRKGEDKEQPEETTTSATVGPESRTGDKQAVTPPSGMPSVDLASLQVRDKRQIDKASKEVRVAEKEPEPAASDEPASQPASAKTGRDDSGTITTPYEQAQQKRRAEAAEAARPEKSEKEKAEKKKIRLKQDDSRRSANKMTVSQALEYQEGRMRSMASIKRQREKAKRDEISDGSKEKIYREVVIPETITVQELANRMAERAADVVKALMKMGTMAAASQSIDADTAELVVEEFGHTPKRVQESDVENVLIEEDEDRPEELRPRPPVVTIMGHVDHGKTSLLDALRETSVVAGEAGGITQHIGAYQVETGGEKVTFLDTPGHEAFTAMRSRGAQSTDIVVLVVAADDGVKPQTQEAINHARAAEVPIVVAINKVDKPEADPQLVKTELMQYELVGEEYGGDVQMVEVSAKGRQGLDTLIETILLQAEIMELDANPGRAASGAVIESRMEKGRGTVATLLVQRGTLRLGDIVVAGSSWGKIRAIVDDQQQSLDAAEPSRPVEVLGLGEPPMAGDVFTAVESEKTARDITEYRQNKAKDRQAAVTARSLDQLFSAASGEQASELNLIVKADVQGSNEAIIGGVQKFDGDEVRVKVIHSGVGAISESDVSLAQATGAIIIGFNVRAAGAAKRMAEQEKLDIRYYSVIYDLIDDVRDALSGMLSPERREEMIGYAEIREVFNISRVGTIAGCYITDGEVRRGAGVRLLRDNVVIHEGKLKTLKRFKDEVKEVKKGYECGMAFENYEDLKVGDVIEAYEVKEIARQVSA